MTKRTERSVSFHYPARSRQLALGLLGSALIGAGLLAVSPAARAQMPPAAVGRPNPMENQGPDKPLDAATRQQVLDKVIGLVRNDYAVPSVGEQMARAVEAARKKGSYNSITSSMALADRLTDDLRAVSKDLHLKVIYKGNGFPGLRAQTRPALVPAPTVTPAPALAPAPGPVAQVVRPRGAGPAKSNFEYHEARWMPGNVGYLKISSFAAPDEMAADVRKAAMAFLRNTDALVIDLRGNNGGGPQPSLLGYFFNEAKLIGTEHFREGNRVEEKWTIPAGQAAYGETKPVYILVDKDTFSAGESFAYNLQGLGRAKLVGEKTKGGARPSTMKAISDNFAMTLAFAYSKHAVTKTDWEGVGLKPDIEVPADKALDVAYRAALQDVQASAARP